MKLKDAYREKIYAGVLGKLIGVYLGRPVEGWPYQKIIDRFGEVRRYVHRELGLPLIVADDDVSGTFAFFRTTADYDIRNRQITAKQIGDTWLNYIIENKTILWWGGLGNSTEHTAFLRLKNGIPAPASGSMALNGPVLSQQIGAQIFMDAYAMMCPGNPEQAAYYVRQAASVSHDGLAVDAACFLGAMEALAFEESRLETLFDECSRFIQTPKIESLVKETREICAKEKDWRAVRAQLDARHGYHLHPGPCHMIPNHAMVLASLLMAGDDFEQSVTIAASAAWDTDCNAGNVGCLNGIRLGLKGIDAGVDYRSEMADRMYVVTSDGGECVTDAVKETRKIIAAAAKLAGEADGNPPERYAFEYPGATQGFMVCPLAPAEGEGQLEVLGSASAAAPGLRLRVKDGEKGLHASVATFLEYGEAYTNYETYASPTLYGTQTVVVRASAEGNGMKVTPYLCVVDDTNELSIVYGEEKALASQLETTTWKLPGTQGMPICRFGLKVSGKQGEVLIRSVHWDGAPTFAQADVMMKDMWDLNPYWAQAFVSSANLFAPNLNYTYSISHNGGRGLATIGTRDFTDYELRSKVKLSLHKAAGLVARSRGHRRYYAVVLYGGERLCLQKQWDGETITLASTPFSYEEFTFVELFIRVRGKEITAGVDGKGLLSSVDEAPWESGACGFMVEDGTMFISGLSIQGI